jgi:hypothetical protein
MFVAHFVLGSKEEINVFEVKTEARGVSFYIDPEDSKELLFGRKRVSKSRMNKPFYVSLGRPQWIKDLLDTDNPRCSFSMEYFFGCSKKEAIRNLIERERFYQKKRRKAPAFRHGDISRPSEQIWCRIPS